MKVNPMTESHSATTNNPSNVDALFQRWLERARIEMEGEEVHKLPYTTAELIPSLMGFALISKEILRETFSKGARAAFVREIEREGYTKSVAVELMELVTVVMYLDTWHLKCTGNAFSTGTAGELEGSKDLLLAVSALRASAISRARARAKKSHPELG
jgi:hypothetical protein